jgi:hypothetical protein
VLSGFTFFWPEATARPTAKAQARLEAHIRHLHKEQQESAANCLSLRLVRDGIAKLNPSAKAYVVQLAVAINRMTTEPSTAETIASLIAYDQSGHQSVTVKLSSLADDHVDQSIHKVTDLQPEEVKIAMFARESRQYEDAVTDLLSDAQELISEPLRNTALSYLIAVLKGEGDWIGNVAAEYVGAWGTKAFEEKIAEPLVQYSSLRLQRILADRAITGDPVERAKVAAAALRESSITKALELAATVQMKVSVNSQEELKQAVVNVREAERHAAIAKSIGSGTDLVIGDVAAEANMISAVSAAREARNALNAARIAFEAETAKSAAAIFREIPK